MKVSQGFSCKIFFLFACFVLLFTQAVVVKAEDSKTSVSEHVSTDDVDSDAEDDFELGDDDDESAFYDDDDDDDEDEDYEDEDYEDDEEDDEEDDDED